jgi:hypothetical protein
VAHRRHPLAFSAARRKLTPRAQFIAQLRSSHRTVDCPLKDDGEATCARFCASEHLAGLRAFTVTALDTTSPPPPPPPPPPPSPPPPSPPSVSNYDI